MMISRIWPRPTSLDSRAKLWTPGGSPSLCLSFKFLLFKNCQAWRTQFCLLSLSLSLLWWKCELGEVGALWSILHSFSHVSAIFGEACLQLLIPGLQLQSLKHQAEWCPGTRGFRVFLGTSLAVGHGPRFERSWSTLWIMAYCGLVIYSCLCY